MFTGNDLHWAEFFTVNGGLQGAAGLWQHFSKNTLKLGLG